MALRMCVQWAIGLNCTTLHQLPGNGVRCVKTSPIQLPGNDVRYEQISSILGDSKAIGPTENCLSLKQFHVFSENFSPYVNRFFCYLMRRYHF